MLATCVIANDRNYKLWQLALEIDSRPGHVQMAEPKTPISRCLLSDCSLVSTAIALAIPLIAAVVRECTVRSLLHSQCAQKYSLSFLPILSLPSAHPKHRSGNLFETLLV